MVRLREPGHVVDTERIEWVAPDRQREQQEEGRPEYDIEEAPAFVSTAQGLRCLHCATRPLEPSTSGGLGHIICGFLWMMFSFPEKRTSFKTGLEHFES